MEHKIKHLMQVPWTGLGLYNGFRGNRWLKNRIQVFKQFVIPSLQAQTNKNFILHCCWRREEKSNTNVKELIAYLESIKEFKTVHTFHGILFWDDKYPDDIARDRLLTSLHGTMGELLDTIGECDYVISTIQPSDDTYHKNAVKGIQAIFNETDLQAVGFRKGYIMNYQTKDLAEYNPLTIPPFFTIKFPRAVFIDPLRHADYTGPYKSHEYIADKLKFGSIDERGFCVGTHLDNISTVFDHPYAGKKFTPEEAQEIFEDFGIDKAEKLKIPFSLGRVILNKLPYGVKRKLRFWAGEKKWILRPLFAFIYNLLRS